jgi:hypothetical protein
MFDEFVRKGDIEYLIEKFEQLFEHIQITGGEFVKALG